MLIKRLSSNFKKYSNSNYTIIFVSLIAFFLGMFCIILQLERKTMNCVYVSNLESYNCKINSKIFSIDTGTNQFNNITKAVLEQKRSHCANGNKLGEPCVLYHMYFVNKYGSRLFVGHLGYSMEGLFLKKKDNYAYESAIERVDEINDFFNKNKDFIYELPSKF